jgi:hypothetical protein
VINRRLSVLGAAAAVATLAAAVGPVRAQVGAPPPSLEGLRPAATATAAGCPTATDDATVESAEQLLADNRVMADLGRRPTGSPAQLRFIEWLEQSMGRLPGMQMGAIGYDINRWVDGGASLRAGGPGQALSSVPLSGAVPYGAPTPRRGVTGKLVYVPWGTALSAQDIEGKVVVRDAMPGTVPYAAFRAVSWFEWDPSGSLAADAPGTYERDFAGYNQRIVDLDDAAKGKAAAIVFVHGFPRGQVTDHYAPYEGTAWKVPALYLGVDEGERLKDLAAHDGSALVTLKAKQVKTPTRTVVATLPGNSSERIVIESHTDGMNAVWDNGPIAILALARHFAALPQKCRPRTLQFVFTTAHLYQRLAGGADRGGGAEQVARQLDEDYGDGTVALAFALEHLGAREYEAVPRPALPGRYLRPTGRNELNTLFVGESPLLVQQVIRAVVQRDIARTFVMRGADAPGATIPPHNSYGGEGGAYQQHLIPTIALVTGPWTLYNPSFGMEAIDGDLMHKQTLLFADLIHGLADQPRELLGGGYLGYRAARDVMCGSGLATLGLTRCPGVSPYG